MTPQDAIPILKRLQEPEPWEPQISRDAYEALELAIEALEDREQIFHLECLRCKKPVGTYSRQTMEQVSYTHYSYCEDCLRKGLKMLKKQDALDKQSASTEQVDYKAQVKILADVLDSCPLTEPCDWIWSPTGWCQDHCKDGQDSPDAECWMRYARVMAESKTESDHIADSDKMVDLKMRTITERLIIAKSLIDSVIADSDNDQFRDSTKKTDDVPDIHVGKTDFQPGDKFILELGAERRMFGEFEIKGTDLYVKTDLLEKLTRYEPEMKTEKIPYKKPEIIRCKDCQYRDPEDKKCDHGHGIVWQLPRPDDWFCADGKA